MERVAQVEDENARLRTELAEARIAKLEVENTRLRKASTGPRGIDLRTVLASLVACVAIVVTAWWSFQSELDFSGLGRKVNSDANEAQGRI